ncbi:uncharacterized protein LOC107762050 [Nicotiana tabacum]|uniref:Trihelix transcription factor GT-2 n=1 Tax=Nicotiana tabacum TaxID=4097 RepID=A0A1S3X7J0_TOBAC|nr:PREDICTED: trihelix transcription factor GT-2-like [Nicotiana tabacum]
MQSDYEMAGIHQHRNRNQQPQVEQQQQQQQHRFIMENASTSSPFFPINYSHHYPPQQPNPLLQPFTQQFFQYQHLHYRSILEQQQHQDIRLELNAEGENHQVQGVSVPFFPLSFKEDSSSKGEREEDALIRGSEGYCNEARQTSLAVSHCWQNQEDSAIKQPFWKPLCAEFSNGNNNNSNESEKNKQEEDQEMYPDEIHQQQIIKSLEENKCRVVFGELEAIYATNAETNTTATTNIHRMASESVLTAEDLPINNNNNVSFPVATCNDSNQTSGPTAIATTTPGAIDIGSDSASVGEATREDEVHNKRKRRRKAKEGTSITMARFFESLVKKLVNHQEDLQKRFMETIERLDQERKEREETWREQELAKLKKEAAVRAQERTLASNREAALVSYLEKLTGQKINFQHGSEPDKSCNSLVKLNNKRWPQAEVEALIQIRNSLESKFQEAAGPKGVLWEEISNSMASMGFERSARRCKEKWENMHKCRTVKRTKEITREQLDDGNNNIDFVTQGNDTVDDHLGTVNLTEGNKGNSEKDKHGNGESKNGNWKEEMEEIKEGEI